MELIGLLIIGALLRMLFLFGMERLIKPEKVHNNSILRLVRPDKQHKREWKIVPLSIMIDALAVFIPAQLGLIKIGGAIELWKCALFVVFHNFAIEFFGYWLHRALHTFPSLYRIHADHHVSIITAPSTSLLFSLSERLLLATCAGIGVLLFCQIVGPFPFWLLVISLSIHDLLNILAHGNREVTPKWFGKIGLSRYIFSPTHHALHHINQRGNYSFFSPLLDHIFGTYLLKTEDLAVRARNGKGLTSLRERESNSEPIR